MPLLALCALLSAPAPADRPPPGSAWVRAENDGAGAGFVIDVEKKWLITCRHVVAERAKVDVIFPWVENGELVTDRQRYLSNRPRLRELGLLVTGKVLKKSDELDVALVELESLPKGVTSVRFAARPPAAGESLRAFGHRIDLETVWNLSAGPLRTGGRLADGYFWRGRKLAADADVLIAQLPTEEGDSGAAVFDARGEVVGMVAALRRQCPLAAVVISAQGIRAFAGFPVPPANEKPNGLAETLHRATVWVRPSASAVRLAGVLIGDDLVLTNGKGLAAGDRVGIALPVRDGDRWVPERSAYRDPLDLKLKGYWRGGTVVARDAERDLALLRLDAPAAGMRPLPLAAKPPATGDAVHTMSHPGGLEFAWVYAAGVVRQRGKLVLGEGERAVSVLVCQLPAQGGSPGGAVVNGRGELVGVVSPKEGAQMVATAVAADEIDAFLDVALHDRPPRTLAALRVRAEAVAGGFIGGAALDLARQAEAHDRAGRPDEAHRHARAALSLDPGCGPARVCRAELLLREGRLEAAAVELDLAVEKGPFDRDVLQARAELAAATKDWRRARGDLQRILDTDPADAEARQWLANAHLELGDDAKAAAALADTLRADPKRLRAVAVNLLAQADRLEKKFPDAPAVPADWLVRAMTAAGRTEFADALRRAAAAKSNDERLAVLRAGAKKVAGE